MKNKHLLCITPDFNRSGAPIALLRLITILKTSESITITVMAYGKGDLLAPYTDLLGENHVIILNGLNPSTEFRTGLQSHYDIILLNTAAVYPFSFFFQNTDIPVIWWTHEAPELIVDSFPAFPNPHLLSPNFKICTPSKGAAERFRSDYSYDPYVLPAPVSQTDLNEPDLMIDIPEGKVVFFIPGAYSYIKGQDILLSAVLSLPHDLKNRSYFIFCGYTLDKQLEYKRAITDTASRMDNVLMLENLSQDTVYSLMKRSHCIAAPSRIDCLPTTIAEGFMFKKLCLVSDRTGISAYMKDCVNGFIFKDHDDLVKRLMLIISDFDSLGNISENGYEIYKQIFSPDSVLSVIKDLF